MVDIGQLWSKKGKKRAKGGRSGEGTPAAELARALLFLSKMDGSCERSAPQPRVLLFRQRPPGTTGTRREDRGLAADIAKTGDLKSRVRRAADLGESGFLDGAVAILEQVLRVLEPDDRPGLALETLFLLALFLARQRKPVEALRFAEEGLLLAWEAGANDELEAFDLLAERLARPVAKRR